MKERLTLKFLKPLVGKELQVSDWMTIDQKRICDFAECTEDRQWIHVDAEKARQGPLGSPIAHGFLLLALLPFFHRQNPLFQRAAKMLVNYGLNRVRFISPVKVGSRIRNRSVLKEVRRKGFRRVLLTLENTLEIEGGDKPAMIAEFLVLVVL